MTRTKQWLLLTALVVVALLAGGWFMLVSPERAKAAAARSATAASTQQVEQLQVQAATLARQTRQVPLYRARLRVVGVHMPATPDVAALVRFLSIAADTAGVELSAITPGTPTPDTAGGTSTGGVSAAPTGYAAIPVSLTLRGGYYQTEQFLSALESNARTFLVTGVTAAPAKSSNSATDVARPGDLDTSVTGRVLTTAGATVGAAPRPHTGPAGTSSGSSTSSTTPSTSTPPVTTTSSSTARTS